MFFAALFTFPTANNTTEDVADITDPIEAADADSVGDRPMPSVFGDSGVEGSRESNETNSDIPDEKSDTASSEGNTLELINSGTESDISGDSTIDDSFVQSRNTGSEENNVNNSNNISNGDSLENPDSAGNDSNTDISDQVQDNSSVAQVAEPVVIPQDNPADMQNNTSGMLGNNTGNSSGNANNFDTYYIPENQQTAETYVLNTSSMKIHHPNCSSVPKIKPENYATSSQSLDELQLLGYSRCGICFK